MTTLAAILILLTRLEFIKFVRECLIQEGHNRSEYYAEMLEAKRLTMLYIRYLKDGNVRNKDKEFEIAEKWDLASVAALNFADQACEICRELSETFQHGEIDISEIEHRTKEVVMNFDNGGRNYIHFNLETDEIYICDINNNISMQFIPDNEARVLSQLPNTDNAIICSSTGYFPEVSLLNIENVQQLCNQINLVSNPRFQEVRVTESLGIAQLATGRIKLYSPSSSDHHNCLVRLQLPINLHRRLIKSASNKGMSLHEHLINVLNNSDNVR